MNILKKIRIHKAVAVAIAAFTVCGSLILNLNAVGQSQSIEKTAYAATNPKLLLLGDGKESIADTLNSVQYIANTEKVTSTIATNAAIFKKLGVEYTDVTSVATANLSLADLPDELNLVEGQYVYTAPSITDIGSIDALRSCLQAEIGNNAYAYCATFVTKFINKNISENSCFYPSALGVTDSVYILLEELQSNSDYNEVGRITGASISEITNFVANNAQPGDIIIYCGRYVGGDYVHCGIMYDNSTYIYDRGKDGNVTSCSIYWYLDAVKNTADEATGAILFRPGLTGREKLNLSGSEPFARTTYVEEAEATVTPEATITEEAENTAEVTEEATDVTETTEETDETLTEGTEENPDATVTPEGEITPTPEAEETPTPEATITAAAEAVATE